MAAPLTRKSSFRSSSIVFTMPTGDFRGGAERMLRNLAVGLQERGVFAHYLFLGDGPLYQELLRREMDVCLIKAGRIREIKNYAAAVTGIYREIRRMAPDIVIDWMTKGRVYSGIAAAFSRRTTGIWLHDFVGKSLLERCSRLLPTTRVWASSQAIADSAKPYRLNPTVVHPGVDTVAFAPMKIDRAALFGEFHIPQSSFVIGTVARLVRWKGIDVAIKSLPFLPVKVHLVVVGGAHFSEQDYPAKLSQLAQELGVASRVHLVGHQSGVERWMNVFDVFLHLTTRPNPADQVIKEAMACSCPVIATGEGYTGEVIEDRSNGVLIDTAQVDEVVPAMNWLLEDSRRRENIGQKGRETIRQRFSLDSMVDNFLNSLYQDSQSRGVAR